MPCLAQAHTPHKERRWAKPDLTLNPGSPTVPYLQSLALGVLATGDTFVAGHLERPGCNGHQSLDCFLCPCSSAAWNFPGLSHPIGLMVFFPPLSWDYIPLGSSAQSLWSCRSLIKIEIIGPWQYHF